MTGKVISLFFCARVTEEMGVMGKIGKCGIGRKKHRGKSKKGFSMPDS